MTTAETLPVEFADIVGAAARIAPVAVKTPLLNCSTLDELAGAKVFVKAEVLQRTGSFKLRGAYNRVMLLSPDERRHGVVAFSSGNHAQAVAWAARAAGASALIVMPKSAPAIKAVRTRGYGAEVELFEGDRTAMQAYARLTASERGATLIPPFDDPTLSPARARLDSK